MLAAAAVAGNNNAAVVGVAAVVAAAVGTVLVPAPPRHNVVAVDREDGQLPLQQEASLTCHTSTSNLRIIKYHYWFLFLS